MLIWGSGRHEHNLTQAGLATLKMRHNNIPCMIPQMHTQAMQALKHPWLRNIGSDKEHTSTLISRTEEVDENIIKVHTCSSTDHPTSMPLPGRLALMCLSGQVSGFKFLINGARTPLFEPTTLYQEMHTMGFHRSTILNSIRGAWRV